MTSLVRKLLQFEHLSKLRLFNFTRSFSRAPVLSKERPSTESLIKWKKLPAPKKREKDFWTEKRALFGENDYKDILGDGTYHLRRNIRNGPLWMRGWKGNELQMLIRKRNNVGYKLGPEAKHNLYKRTMFLYKRLNRNKGKWYYRGDH